MSFVMDVTKTVGEISPLWFGHNLEHTRSCVWQGLSAQLVRNRKFAGLPQQHSGVAQDWYRIGPPECWHLLELGGSSWSLGHVGEPYTAHFDPDLPTRHNTRQRQRMEMFRDGVPCGIGQSGLYLQAGKGYEGRVALLSDRELLAKVRITSGEQGQAYFEASFAVSPDDWMEAAFSFLAPDTDPDARIEITFDQAGILYVGAVSLLPDDHFYGMRRDVVDLLKEISVPILRWPGGNFADDYFWKDGLLPVDRRVPVRSHMNETLPHTRDYDTHEIGIDEFMALCRELGAEPFITVNLGLEGPQEAAAWVEYCNGSADTEWGSRRVERGHAEPYRVRYWSLGNEYGYGHMLGPNDPRDYASAAKVCADAMREVDPSLVFTVTGTWWDEAWHRDVLAKVGHSFENISFHDYTPLMKSFAGEEGKREFSRVACKPAAIFEQVRRIRELMEIHAPDGAQVGISFDEWNVWYAWYRSVGVAEGAYAATMLHFFCREAQKLGIVYGAFFEPVNEGAILVNPDGARLTAMGQVFALLKAHQNNQLVELVPQDPDAALDAVASLDEDTKEVVVTLVNRSPDEGQEAAVDLEGGGAIEKVDGILLSSSDFLPGSRFSQAPLQLDVEAGSRILVSLPRHSVALLRVSWSAGESR